MDVAKSVRQLPSVQKYCIMSALESFQLEFKVISGGTPYTVLSPSGTAGAGRMISSYPLPADAVEPWAEPQLPPSSISVSPNMGVASNSALIGSSSISRRKRGVSGMAKRKARAKTPGTAPRPMTHLQAISIVFRTSSRPLLAAMTTIETISAWSVLACERKCAPTASDLPERLHGEDRCHHSGSVLGWSESEAVSIHSASATINLLGGDHS
jgi:hypothetical protein